MTCDPHWTSYLAALLTPIVAVLGVYIAYRQWCLSQNKLKLDLFERRLSVYRAALGLVGSILTSGDVKNEEIFKFLSGTGESKWLFDAAVAEYFEKQLYHKAIDLQTLLSVLPTLPTGDERNDNVRKQAEIKKWFARQYKALEHLLARFLQLSH